MIYLKPIKQSDAFFYLFSIFYLLSLFFSPMSNYRLISFIIKIFFSLITFTFLFLDYKKNNFNFSRKIYSQSNKYILFLFSILIIILTISITYSADKVFGFLKILNLIINFTTLYFSTIYLLIRINSDIFSNLYKLITPIIVISILTAIFLDPFRYFYDPHKFDYKIWSHVLYGKFLGIFFFVSIIYFFRDKKANSYIIFFVMLIIITGMYFTGLRSSFLMLLIISVFFLVYYIIKSHRILKLILASFLILYQTTLLIWNPGFSQIQKERFDNIFEFEKKINYDAPLSSRYYALQESKELFSDNWIKGVGFGGFRSQSELTEYLKYPHNIFVEFAVELGIFGIAYFLIFLVLVLIRIWHSSFIFRMFFLYGFCLSMISKDIANQSLLFISLALLSIKMPVEVKSDPDKELQDLTMLCK